MSIPIINMSKIPINISDINEVNTSRQFLSDVNYQDAYRLCVEEVYSMNIIVFSLMNVITLIAMMYFQKIGRNDLADRGINILFLVNVFALTANIVISMGLKFYPA